MSFTVIGQRCPRCGSTMLGLRGCLNPSCGNNKPQDTDDQCPCGPHKRRDCPHGGRR